MNYRESLNKVNELGLTVCQLEVANSCDCLFEFDYTPEEFETLCDFAEYIYLKADSITTDAIAKCINNLMINEGLDVVEVTAMDKWDFIGKVSDWMD